MIKVYVDFDSILDTRMAIINYMDAKASIELAGGTNYFKRQNNDFTLLLKGFDQKKFEELYAKRTLSMVAGRAHMTKVVEVISTFSRTKLSTATVVDENPNIEVTVNLHPYKLNKEEKRQLTYQLKHSFFAKGVKLVNWAPETLTPRKMGETYEKVIMYDFDAWQKIHYAELFIRPFPKVEVIHPFIATAIVKKGLAEMIRSTENFYRPIMQLEILPLEIFSFTVPEAIKANKETEA